MQGRHRVGALVALPQVLRDLGHDADAVLMRAGIDGSLLSNPENALTFIELGRLFQTCVDLTGCPHVGLLVGQRSATGALGLVGQLMRHAPTLGDAIRDLCANQVRYIQGAVAYLMVRDGTAYWGYTAYIPGVCAVEQINDGAVAIGVNIMRELAGVAPDDVLLCRPTPPDVGAYRRCLGVTPRFMAEQYAVVFPARLLASKVRGADGELRRRLERAVADYWAVQRPSFTDRVVRHLRARVLFAETSLESVAGDLLVEPRTLNRRLQAEGTRFRDLLNRARFDVARTLLAGTGMSVTELALALGYADTSAFTHAFQRWAGTSPSQWRQHLEAA
ncbi:MAG: AraC family transcriptional regulator [Rhodospirillales bacterium]|jgi:AraC-like DNA-binding protein|nr:AraC family transcriptional regulator [Rhodospirillales bacterium]